MRTKGSVCLLMEGSGMPDGEPCEVSLVGVEAQVIVSVCIR